MKESSLASLNRNEEDKRKIKSLGINILSYIGDQPENLIISRLNFMHIVDNKYVYDMSVGDIDFTIDVMKSLIVDLEHIKENEDCKSNM